VTDKLCQLAQGLRDDVASGRQGYAFIFNAANAQIEKLAKSVKEKMQMQ
jgi:hypothetical protein